MWEILFYLPGFKWLLSKIFFVNRNPQFQACLATPACWANRIFCELFTINSVLNPSSIFTLSYSTFLHLQLYNIPFLDGFTRQKNTILLIIYFVNIGH